MKKRSRAMDSMKGIAMIGVVIAHSNMINWDGLCGQVAKAGGRGVQIFFIISAMLTFKSLEKSGCGTKVFNIKQWYYRKFLRLIPLYWIAIISYLVIFGTAYFAISSNKGIVLWTVVSNFLFVSGIDSFHLNQFWYLGALGVFIIVSPFLYKFITNWGRALLLFGITWTISLVGSIGVSRINLGYNYESWSTYWRSHSIISNLPVLSLGILLYFLFYREEIHVLVKKSINKYNISLKRISRVTLLCLLWLVVEHIYNGSSIVEYALLFSMILSNEMIFNNRIITNSIFELLGKYSYGIYLFHLPVMHILLKMYPENNYYTSFIIVVVTIGISLGVSVLATNVIEKPIISKLKK